MKGLVVFLCVLAAVAASDKWADFKTTYGKSYANSADELYRKSIFEDTLKFIAEHNARYEQGFETYTVGMNKLGDMTQEEIVSQMMGLPIGGTPPASKNLHVKTNRPLATDWDWRDHGAVTPIKDQGQCGSCWAFSSTGSLEGMHFLKTGELISLSEQDLVDCSGDWGNWGCNGGWQQLAFLYIMDVGGINSEAAYPYEAIDNNCRHDASKIVATVNDYVNIPTADETALQDAVHNIGPVTVSIDSTRPSFSYYESGVYFDPNCKTDLLSHAVLAVGFGEENGQEYWLVKNSWGESWGMTGYIKMAKNRDNHCGVATDASYPTV